MTSPQRFRPAQLLGVGACLSGRNRTSQRRTQPGRGDGAEKDWTRTCRMGSLSGLRARRRNSLRDASEFRRYPAAEDGLELDRNRDAQMIGAMCCRDLDAHRQAGRAEAEWNLGNGDAGEVEDG
jgi:hypothetical protein